MRDVLVLCYHAVSPSWEADLSITPTALDRQLTYVMERGWQPVTFAEAALGTSPGRVLSITFDDAFASVKEHAAPILRRYGAPATVFAPTAFMGGDASLVWAGIDQWQQTAHAAELKAMGWDDLAELADAGWEIGSHTRTHPSLTRLDDGALGEELAASRQECSERLGRPCQTIAYPFGDVDPRVAAAAAAAGYLAGARLSSGLLSLGPYMFPRMGIYHTDYWLRFRLKVARPVRRIRATATWRRLRS
jgi:peptidoglycan/xylan/chitin deacetylase (PgdA/CDA1 family)